MEEQKRFVATLYNNNYPIKEIQEKLNEQFGTNHSSSTIFRWVKKMKDDGTLDCISFESNTNETVEIISELRQAAGGSLFKVGVLDIETTGLFSDFGYILCAVIKNLDGTDNNYDIFRLDETPTYRNKKALSSPDVWKRIDRDLLVQLLHAYKKYDIIVHFNGRNFDIKFINTRLVKNRLELLPETKQLDIYQIAKHRLRLRSKRLDALKEFLEIDTKEEGHRWEYWQMAGAGVKEGFDYVVEHCKRDVDRLASVAVELKHFISYITR